VNPTSLGSATLATTFAVTGEAPNSLTVTATPPGPGIAVSGLADATGHFALSKFASTPFDANGIPIGQSQGTIESTSYTGQLTVNGGITITSAYVGSYAYIGAYATSGFATSGGSTGTFAFTNGGAATIAAPACGPAVDAGTDGARATVDSGVEGGGPAVEAGADGG
jgi:hypothetical protein